MDMLHLLLESCGFSIDHRTTAKNYMTALILKHSFFILLQPVASLRQSINPATSYGRTGTHSCLRLI